MLESLRRATELIDTSNDDPDATRALVVWNAGETSSAGIAVYHAEYPMRSAASLVGVDVRDGDGLAVPAALRNVTIRNSGEGAGERPIVIFDLVFVIREIPPRSWDTYFASYAQRAREEDKLRESPEADVAVLETLCHGGPLPPRGSFDKLSPFVLY